MNIVNHDAMCHCCRYDVYCAWCGQSLFAPYNVRYAAINCDWYSSLSFINDDYEKSIRMANIEASST